MRNIFLNIFKFPTTRRPPLPVIFNLLNGPNKDEGTFVAGNIELGTWNMVCHKSKSSEGQTSDAFVFQRNS